MPALIKAGNLDELTITTNGSQLHKMADQLVDAGVKRLNISIDTLDPERFREITRWGNLDNVLAGLESAKKAGRLFLRTLNRLKHYLNYPSG